MRLRRARLSSLHTGRNRGGGDAEKSFGIRDSRAEAQNAARSTLSLVLNLLLLYVLLVR
jgi:hypothetical protein